MGRGKAVKAINQGNDKEREESQMIDIHAVDIKTLPSMPFANRRYLPDSKAVYFILGAAGKIIYIGQTTSLVRRLAAHSRLREFRKLGCDRIAWLTSDNDVRQLESAFIAQLRPLLNINHNALPSTAPVIRFRSPQPPQVHRPSRPRRNYSRAYQAIEQLQPNEWLPVQFRSRRDARNFYYTAMLLRTLPLEPKLRGDTVYVRKRMAKNGSKSKGGK